MKTFDDTLPMLEELIKYVKKLALSSILKDETKAGESETLEIKKKADMYILCVENRVRFESFEYTIQDYLDLGILLEQAERYIKEPYSVPEEIRKRLIEKFRINYINNYVEENNYYRSLNGLPDLKDLDIYVPDYMVPQVAKKMVDITKPIHLMDKTDVDLLYNLGVMDKIKDMYPDKRYLNFLGSRKIDVYTARIAPNFYLLYTTNDCPREVSSKFKEIMEKTRVYTLKVIYSDAFKMQSEYYDNFIAILIIIQSIVEMFNTMPEMIIKREFFDIRTIQIVFESHGVDFFPEIPFRYQLAMVKNINRLIKYKSTTKNIVDICSLFGFDNIEVFKYYLLKHRRVDKDTGEFVYNYKDQYNPITQTTEKVLDDQKNYDLKFIKVPIEDNPDDYIHDKTKFIDYDDITLGDKYWDGDLAHDLVRQAILEKEFNYIQSKYISIDTIYSITELSFELTYFYNMIFDDVMVESKLTMPLPVISNIGEFRFIDIICYLYGLMYLYNGVEDDLMDTPTKVMYIKGFNFNANMADLATYIRRHNFTMKDLGIDDFQTPQSDVLTYEQLMTIFTKNVNIYDHVCKQLRTANNYHIYKIYKTIYDSLMINELNMEFFRKSNGVLAKTYTDLLKDRDIILHDSLVKIRNIESLELRREKINNLVNDIIYIIEEYIDLGNFKFVFSALPSVSAEAVKRYIYRVINFFKSYKIDIIGINTIYKFDDKLENKIKMIDDIFIKYIYTKEDTIEALSKLFTTSKLTKEDKIDIKEKIYITVLRWIELLEETNIEIDEKFVEIVMHTLYKDCGECHDKPLYIKSILQKYDRIPFKDFKQNYIKTLKKEDINILEQIYIQTTIAVEKLFKETIDLKEKLEEILIHTEKYEHLIPEDKKYIKAKLTEKDSYTLKDEIVKKQYSFYKEDEMKLIESIFFIRYFAMTLNDEKYELYSSTDVTASFLKNDKIFISDKIIINKK